jgi:dipeptidyl aminopeptidase/acylaminoacyl peptidase
LITGKRVFDGDSAGQVIAAILKDQPPSIRESSPSTPTGIDRVVHTCLEKDPDKRWQSARELSHALEWMASEASTPRVPSTPVSAPARSIRRWQGATVVGLTAAAIAIWVSRPAPPRAVEPIRFQVLPPADSQFGTYVGLSPDGEHLAFTAIGADGIDRLWIRDLQRLEARVLSGTEGAASIIWSPDSRHIAFGFSNQLKRIDINGGPPRIVCEADSPVGSGAWTSEDIIIFGSRGGAGGVKRVSASGGVPSPLTSLEGGTSSFPSLLSGRQFLYYRRGPIEGIFSASMDQVPDKQPTRPVLPSDHAGAYVRSPTSHQGYLFFVRDQILMIQPFDERTLTLSGDATAVDRIATVNAYSAFSASTNGRLAYRTGRRSTSQQLTWFDRDGKTLGTVGDPGSHEQIALSPDGKRAVYRDDVAAVRGDLWLADLTRGVSERFTSNGALGGVPVWSPDGTRIAYRVENTVVQKRVNGVGDAEVLLRASTQTTPTSWSRDGRFLLLTRIGPANTRLGQRHFSRPSTTNRRRGSHPMAAGSRIRRTSPAARKSTSGPLFLLAPLNRLQAPA